MSNETITIRTLSKQAGKILRHLTWLPKDMLMTIKRYPYHSARCFAKGMEEVVKRFDLPNYYIVSRQDLCMTEFLEIIPQRVSSQLKSLGEMAEECFFAQKDLKRFLNMNNPVIARMFTYYDKGSSTREPIRRKYAFGSICRNIDEYFDAIERCEDSGASGLDGMKECWLVLNEWKKAFIHDNPQDQEVKNVPELELIISNLDTEDTPFPKEYYLQPGDELLLDKTGGYFERGWPDVVKRGDKYTVLSWLERDKNSVFYTSSQASDFDDIRVPSLSSSFISKGSSNIVLAKKERKWGAILNGARYFLKIIVPFTFTELSDVEAEVRRILKIDYDFVSWDDYPVKSN